ncbi:hypothetical protein HDG36_000767 [Paraburkholderia sp. Kb1A]|nr:hypothetical protein [Paraburkholderia sp. Kb1A]
MITSSHSFTSSLCCITNYADTIIMSAEPTQTNMCVRKPAAHDNRSRS